MKMSLYGKAGACILAKTSRIAEGKLCNLPGNLTLCTRWKWKERKKTKPKTHTGKKRKGEKKKTGKKSLTRKNG